ncbi:selenoneine biosynthesis selenosugar synthase SenB [Actinoplanes sp. NPDC049681]|uniref:selenoneine biosynthesis selenosugar synthase SenB n=1 Tax=Actinoplanes sp. NPDC049681 TaxID=3363905 RepID=UPI0037B249F4
MKILLATPEPPASDYGNSVTARRWAGIFRDLGHEVRVCLGHTDGEYDALVALHAGRSADVIRRFAAQRPGAPVVIGLTGTDLYPDFATSGVDPAVLDMADRFVALQSHGVRQLPPRLRPRARVITQSLSTVEARPSRMDCFEVAFLAHVRPVKDPLLPAQAVRLLPADSRIVLTHAGGARDEESERAVAAEAAENPRYHWLGALPRTEALGVLARSRLLVLASQHEGGANVVTEALALGVPVISTRIPGSTGLLGDDYPGYFPVGDAEALAAALYAVEQNRDGFHDVLKERCGALRHLAEPDRERNAWSELWSGLRAEARALHPSPTAPGRRGQQ